MKYYNIKNQAGESTGVFKKQFSMISESVLDEITGQASFDERMLFSGYGEGHKTSFEFLNIDGTEWNLFNWNEMKIKLYFAINRKRYKHHAIKMNLEELMQRAGLEIDFHQTDQTTAEEKEFQDKHLMMIGRSLLELCLQGHLAIKLPFDFPMNVTAYKNGQNELQMYLLSYHENKNDFVYRETKNIPFAYLQEWNRHFEEQISNRYQTIMKQLETENPKQQTNDVFDNETLKNRIFTDTIS